MSDTSKRNRRHLPTVRNILRKERSPYVALARRGDEPDNPEPTTKPDTPRVAWLKRLVDGGAFTEGTKGAGLLRHDVIDPDTRKVIRAEVFAKAVG